YLVEQHALPDASLIAMVPVSLRLRGEVSPAAGEHAGGNAIGTVLCDLATDSDDPAVRLARVQTSMSRGKRSLAEMSQLQILAMSALTVAPLALGPIPGVVDRLRPPFNVIISNVPGPKTPMYWNGARLDGIYPVSLVLDGQALNITVTTYHDHLEFGLIGCRRSIPHLQRMLTHLETSLAELELIGK
ncbi:MAG: DUF1298 domain-containing protein, partial [Sciscionella sp.]|nr:DUF1298 domain-containing protein [Sciscionella sp.]